MISSKTHFPEGIYKPWKSLILFLDLDNFILCDAFCYPGLSNKNLEFFPSAKITKQT